MSFIADHAAPAIERRRSWRMDGLHGNIVQTVLVALAIVLVQILFLEIVSLLTGADRIRGLYESFCRWDGQLYVRIAEAGYRAPFPGTPVTTQTSNVAFFPGYPLASRWLHDALGGAISYRAAMVLSAQLTAWGFWTYWLLFLARWGTPARLATLVTLVIALHPAAFFLVVAYSESLFLAAALGFIYWVTSSSAVRWPLAVVHGFVMTATRMGGVPIAMAPLAAVLAADGLRLMPSDYQAALCSGADKYSALKTSFDAALSRCWRHRARIASVAATAIASSFGVVSFFAYCHWHFGTWNLYMLTQKAGWNLSADWIWWLRPVNYVFTVSLWHPNVVWPDDLSRFAVLATLIAFGFVGRLEFRLARMNDDGCQRRLVFYIAAAGLFFLHAAGVSPILMKSMIRYSFGVHALLLLAWVQLAIDRRMPLAFSRKQLYWCAAGLLALGGVQTAIAWRFFANQWAA